MRVLITTTGYTGHVRPLAPLAHALSAAGHELLVATPERHQPGAAILGATMAPVAEPPDETVAPFQARLAGMSALDAQPTVVADGFTTMRAGAALADLDAIAARFAPDLIVRESLELAGAVVAAHRAIPHVRIALGAARGEAGIIRFATNAVNALGARLGLPSGIVPRALHTAPAFSYLPPALDPPLSGAPVHRVRAAERRPGRRDERLVYVSLGTVAGSMAPLAGLHARVAAALRDVPAQVLLTLGDRAADPSALALPPNVTAVPWIDEDEVLGRADVMVTHGGHGSVVAALTQGVPLAVVPLFASDQWDNAAAVERSGAGVALRGAPRGTFDPPGSEVLGALPGTIGHLLDASGPRRAACRIADQIAALPSAARAVSILERCAAPAALVR